MNDLVRMSIDSRKNAIINGYRIEDENLMNKIEALFERINEFGESCADNMDFETKFATSELNQEYIQLFTEIAKNCPQKESLAQENREIKSEAEYVMDELESEARYQARNATEPMRRRMRQEAYETARDMPVVGEVMNIKQHIDLFNKFKRKKKDKKEVED